MVIARKADKVFKVLYSVSDASALMAYDLSTHLKHYDIWVDEAQNVEATIKFRSGLEVAALKYLKNGLGYKSIGMWSQGSRYKKFKTIYTHIAKLLYTYYKI